MLLSIINYGAEIWGYGNFPAAALQGDMDWISLKYTRYIAMLRLWNRLIKMNNTRLTKRIFLWCHDNPGNTYSEDIMKISNTLSLSPIMQRVFLISII